MAASAPPDACSSYRPQRRKGYLGRGMETDREEDEINEKNGVRGSLSLLLRL